MEQNSPNACTIGRRIPLAGWKPRRLGLTTVDLETRLCQTKVPQRYELWD